MEWYGVVEWMKRSMLRWFGHMERKKIVEFVKKVYLSETEGSKRRRRPFIRCRIGLRSSYMYERVNNRKQGRLYG